MRHSEVTFHKSSGGGSPGSPGSSEAGSDAGAAYTRRDDPRLSLSRRASVIHDLMSLLRGGSIQGAAAGAAGAKGNEAAANAEEASETDAFLHTDSEDDDSMSRQALLDKIRQKKEIIGKVRCQPWNMRRKRRTLRLAQRYLERHESKVSKSHLYLEELNKRIQRFVRWLNNVKIYLIPWEAKIKKIESHFGSVVSSYFTFLRWILWVNFIITFTMTLFVVVPEVLADRWADKNRLETTSSRKQLTVEELKTADHLGVIWDYKGWLEKSPLFYGYYSQVDFVGTTVKYPLPLAYFVVNLFILGFSFFAILKKMAENARSSKIASGKAEQYVFNWKVFTGWDYTIGNPETAGNTVMANVNKIRESIAEYQVKIKADFACVRFLLRVVANILIFSLICFSTFTIIHVVEASKEHEDNPKSNILQKNYVPIVVSLITLIFPNIFEIIGMLERYHPRTSLRLQLARVLVLYVLNYYTLIFALFTKIQSIPVADHSLDNRTLSATLPTTETFYFGGEANRSRIIRQISDDYLISLERLSRQPPSSFDKPYSPANSTAHSTAGLLGLFLQIMSLGNNTESFNRLLEARSSRRFHRQTFDGTQPAHPRRTVTFSATPHPPPPWTTHVPNYGLVGVNRAQAVVEHLKTGELAEPPTVIVTQQARQTSEGTHDCWENMIGQEISKLITMDLVMTIASILVIDFFRAIWVRYCNDWWCWNLELTFPEYGEFKVAENVLHIINNQGMIWLGLFFAPLLPAVNNVKLIILMYMRSWAVMTCNVPAQQIFRASRSSNFYLSLLLLMLFLCTLPVGYVIASRTPSAKCGPFSHKSQFYHVITDVLKERIPPKILEKLEYIGSPGIIIPIILLLVLIIYFLFSLVRGLREANEDLQKQLVHERTEEKKKIFLLAGGGQKDNRKHSAPVGPTSAEIRRQNYQEAHLPLVERRRRESWRQKPDLCNSEEDGLLVSTEGSAIVDDSSPDHSPPLGSPRMPPGAAVNRRRAVQHADIFLMPTGHQPSNHAGGATAGANSAGVMFKPSLSCLREVDNTDSDTDSRQQTKEKKSKGGGILKKISRFEDNEAAPPSIEVVDSVDDDDDVFVNQRALASDRLLTPREIQAASSGATSMTSSLTSASGLTSTPSTTNAPPPDDVERPKEQTLTSRDIQAVLNAAGFTDSLGRPLHCMPEDLTSDDVGETSTDASTRPLLKQRTNGGGVQHAAHVNAVAHIVSSTTEPDSNTDSDDLAATRRANRTTTVPMNHVRHGRRSPLTPASVVLSDSANTDGGSDSDATQPTIIHRWGPFSGIDRTPVAVVSSIPPVTEAQTSLSRPKSYENALREVDASAMLMQSPTPSKKHHHHHRKHPKDTASSFGAWPSPLSSGSLLNQVDLHTPSSSSASLPPMPRVSRHSASSPKHQHRTHAADHKPSPPHDDVPMRVLRSKADQPLAGVDERPPPYPTSSVPRRQTTNEPASIPPEDTVRPPPRFKIAVSVARRAPPKQSLVTAPGSSNASETSSLTGEATSEFISPNAKRKFLIRATHDTDTV